MAGRLLILFPVRVLRTGGRGPPIRMRGNHARTARVYRSAVNPVGCWRRKIKRMRPFRSLSVRLTIQFAFVFAAAMLAVSVTLSAFVAGTASRAVERHLKSSDAVYDRLSQQRAHELRDAAELLACNVGFRAAIARGDQADIQSALGRAAARLHARSAFLVTADGNVSTSDRSVPAAEIAALRRPSKMGGRAAWQCWLAVRASWLLPRSRGRRRSAGWCSPPTSMRARCSASSACPQSRCGPRSSRSTRAAGAKPRAACRHLTRAQRGAPRPLPANQPR